jgi:nucleoside-diphosphate-sugar epimerase
LSYSSSSLRSATPVIRPGTAVAVTGATGFIGGRLVELLVEQGASVTCLLRGTTAGTRLEYTKATAATLDLTAPGPVSAALKGIQLVFHCAFDAENNAWNFDALRTLMEACRTSRCQRLVHVSSFVVYQLPPEGEVTEESAEQTSDRGYAFTKRGLEAELLRATHEGALAGTVVQPTIVYGPHSRPWTIDPAEMLRHGTVILPDAGEGICNAVYVDDVVGAMILAAQSPNAVGERYLVSGPETITWKHFYEAIAQAIGTSGPEFRSAMAIAQDGTAARKYLRLAGDPELAIRLAARIGPVRDLLNAALGALPRNSREQARDRLFGPVASRRGHVHLPNLGQLGFLQSRCTISSGKARRELGYTPRFGFAEGMEPTAHYLRDVYRKAGSARANA